MHQQPLRPSTIAFSPTWNTLLEVFDRLVEQAALRGLLNVTDAIDSTDGLDVAAVAAPSILTDLITRSALRLQDQTAVPPTVRLQRERPHPTYLVGRRELEWSRFSLKSEISVERMAVSSVSA